jgi:hypothetical protein
MNVVSPTKLPTPLPAGLTDDQYLKALEFAKKQTATIATEPSLPDDLPEETYTRALNFVKLASKTYDWDDFTVARIGMNLFSNIDDILEQDFRTPDYIKIGGGGNVIDCWGGKDNGLDYTLFQHKDTQDVVLSFRGTEPLSAEDWVEDAEQVLGTAEQYTNAVNLAKSLQTKVEESGHRLFITGHSLGGGLGTAAALATGCEAVVFDSAGVSDYTIKALSLNVEKNKAKITNFNVRECFVSDWNKKMDETTIGTDLLGVPKQKQYGKIFWLDSVSDRADFKLLPDWTRTAKRAESVLNHAWHVITYQLEHKQFHQKGNDEVNDREGTSDERPSKKLKTSE